MLFFLIHHPDSLRDSDCDGRSCHAGSDHRRLRRIPPNLDLGCVLRRRPQQLHRRDQERVTRDAAAEEKSHLHQGDLKRVTL